MKKTPAVRSSISFPPALYETLEEIAKHKVVARLDRAGRGREVRGPDRQNQTTNAKNTTRLEHLQPADDAVLL